jgi:Mannosyltransferase (PIG-V)
VSVWIRLREERAAWTLVCARVAIWIGAAFTLLWAPLHGARAISPFRAFEGITDLLFGTFAQWDSVWFVHIADHGYDSKQIAAFFPLYPLLVHGLSEITRSTVVAGVLISLAAAAVAAAVLYRIARPRLGEQVAGDTVLYLALYPIAYVATALYSDALFLALAAGAFLAGQRRRSLAAGVLGGLAVSTRVVGLALLPALVVLLWPRGRGAGGYLRLAPLLLLPAALGAYAVYLQHRFGDWLAFVHAQGSVDWNRHVPALGPLQGFWDAASAARHGAAELIRHLPRTQNYPNGLPVHDQWAAWNVLQFVLLLVAIWLTVEAWRRLGAAFGLYSAATILIFLSSPAAFVPLVSEPRFLLSDFPLFLVLACFTERRPRLRLALIVSFSVVAGFAAVGFARHVWIA